MPGQMNASGTRFRAVPLASMFLSFSYLTTLLMRTSSMSPSKLPRVIVQGEVRPTFTEVATVAIRLSST